MAAESASSRQSSDPKQDGRSAQESDKKEEGGKPPHDEGKMFIGGLNWETTDESLKAYFSQFGEVTDCIVMRDPNTSRSRGFGFLTFVDPSVVNTVLVKEHQLDGKIIDPKRAIPREEQEKTEKIFVGGIAPEVTEEEFKDYFSQFGHVIDATLMVDRDTGRPRGFGFITFDSSEPVEKAMNRQDLEIRNKQIEVKRAMPKHKSQRVQPLYSQQSYGSSSSASAGMMTSPASSANSSYGGYGQYSNYSYGSNYPSGYAYSAMTHAYYSSRYGNYGGSQYGSGSGSYGGSGSRGGSYGQWYGRDGYGSGPSSAGGASALGGPSSSSRLGNAYRHSPGRDENYGRDHHHHHHQGSPMYGSRGGNSRSGPARSYSSMNAGGTGALYSSHNVRGQHNYHPYAR
ncbi:subunit of cleavage factor i [Gigaspora margarita]|uniref:Subunit of cleavage factor i n=2 Tax=Gigaspora TaxID=4873 RepID=A0A8H4B1R0_GIGMA|nr:subunit of cleavage factor i [Gigaspora margarita]